MYKEIFNKIENSLRKKYASLNKDFDKEFSESKHVKKQYKRLSDKEIFWTMVCIIFYSGMNAYIVSTKLPTIKKYLYDYQKVMNYSQKELNQYFKLLFLIILASCISVQNYGQSFHSAWHSLQRYL